MYIYIYRERERDGNKRTAVSLIGGFLFSFGVNLAIIYVLFFVRLRTS